MTKPQTQTQPNLDLAEQLGAAEAALHELLVEQEQIPQRSRAAAQEADTEQLIALRERADRLPVAILAARVRVARLRIDYLEAEAVTAEAEARPAMLELDKALAAERKAREAREQLQGLAANLNSGARGLRMELAEAKRALAVLEAEISQPPRPVLRSARPLPRQVLAST